LFASESDGSYEGEIAISHNLSKVPASVFGEKKESSKPSVAQNFDSGNAAGVLAGSGVNAAVSVERSAPVENSNTAAPVSNDDLFSSIKSAKNSVETAGMHVFQKERNKALPVEKIQNLNNLGHQSTEEDSAVDDITRFFYNPTQNINFLAHFKGFF